MVCGAQMRSQKTMIDWPTEDLYPLELSTGPSSSEDDREEQKNLNPDTREFRPKEAAVEKAQEKIKIWSGKEDI